MREAKILQLGLMLSILLTLGGCGRREPRGEVTGHVTLAGKPIPEGTLLLFAPELGWGQEVPIVDGRFALSLADGGLPPGKYQMAVLPAVVETVDKHGEPIVQPKSSFAFPAHAANPATSGLAAEIQVGQNTLQLDLSRTPPQRSR